MGKSTYGKSSPKININWVKGFRIWLKIHKKSCWHQDWPLGNERILVPKGGTHVKK